MIAGVVCISIQGVLVLSMGIYKSKTIYSCNNSISETYIYVPEYVWYICMRENQSTCDYGQLIVFIHL